MRFSYKPIVERFNIPRPTLIEWKKRIKTEPRNWRVKHLRYLQNQVLLEAETINELSLIGIKEEEIFIFSSCLYLEGKRKFMPLNEFKKLLKEFAYTKQNSVEFRHNFAKEIWNIELDDGSGRQIADYYKLFDLLDKLTLFQYFVLFTMVSDFVEDIAQKIDMGERFGLIGKTWQELHSLSKEFSQQSIKSKFFKILI
ncbi:MAG: hypothetical protein GXP61_00700 [Epsilonproteobacteria bacterium]|nr:hypothetical protein [Campylobacterota bacterium]